MADVGMCDCEYLSKLVPELPKGTFEIPLTSYLGLPQFSSKGKSMGLDKGGL